MSKSGLISFSVDKLVQLRAALKVFKWSSEQQIS